MSESWTLAVCEGTHDLTFLTELLVQCGQWKPHSIDDLPDYLSHTKLKPSAFHDTQSDYKNRIKYVEKNGAFMVVRSLSGLGNFGRDVPILLGGLEPTNFCAVIDANGSAIGDRETAFEGWTSVRVKAGEIVGGHQKFGLWVAPNNQAEGTLASLILDALKEANPGLYELSAKFVDEARETADSNTSRMSKSDREKAILGAAGQVTRPGASLAVAIQANRCWLNHATCQKESLANIVRFFDGFA